LLVDTYVDPERRMIENHAKVERGIAIAASLASQALEEGMSVGLFAWSSDGWNLTPPGRGKRHRRDILAMLARLPLNTVHPTRDLMEASHEALEPGFTPVLLTPGDYAVGLGDHLRSGLVVISAASEQGRKWVKFADTVDFDRCMPAEQEPRSKG
jgi:uncharacterized protein (DUF58 family)